MSPEPSLASDAQGDRSVAGPANAVYVPVDRVYVPIDLTVFVTASTFGDSAKLW
jgi:hypothetical protein